MFFLFFLKPLLKENSDFKKVGLASTIIMALFLLLSVASLLLVFPFSTQIKELSPLYYITSIVGSSTFFQQPESIFMFTWILAIMSYITVTISFCILIIEKFAKTNVSKGISIPIAIIIYILAMLPPNISAVRILHEVVYNYTSVGVIMILFFCILIFAYFKNRKKEKLKRSVVENE